MVFSSSWTTKSYSVRQLSRATALWSSGFHFVNQPSQHMASTVAMAQEESWSRTLALKYLSLEVTCFTSVHGSSLRLITWPQPNCKRSQRVSSCASSWREKWNGMWASATMLSLNLKFLKRLFFISYITLFNRMPFRKGTVYNCKKFILQEVMGESKTSKDMIKLQKFITNI